MSKLNNLTCNFLILLLLLIIASCAPSRKVEIAHQQLIEYNNRINEIDVLFRRGSYVCLKEAYQRYQELLSIQEFQEKTREKLLKTALLLALRELELGIAGDKYMQEASSLIHNFPLVHSLVALSMVGP